MFKFYPIVILLYVFCIYHAYSNKADQKWFWIILIFPFFGSVFYLYDTFYRRDNIDYVKEEVKSTLVHDYKTNKLEKHLKVTDTVTNRVELGDEYSRKGNYVQALSLFHSCDEGIYKNDVHLLLKIVKNSYLLEDYKAVIEFGEKIKHKKEFENSNEKAAYAWALHFENRNEEALKNFEELNISFSNYESRLEYARFLQVIDKGDLAKSLINEMLEEIESMDSYEKKMKKAIYKEIRNASSQL
ncbi:MAG: hypothetical protein ACJA1A_001281 [Saprospiraceae bacterium]|jgi:hypothetical protein|tara:strand:+ start:74 stop:802 length:729 start_codon:yes stop_codon:yes gene_type:complete